MGLNSLSGCTEDSWAPSQKFNRLGGSPRDLMLNNLLKRFRCRWSDHHTLKNYGTRGKTMILIYMVSGTEKRMRIQLTEWTWTLNWLILYIPMLILSSIKKTHSLLYTFFALCHLNFMARLGGNCSVPCWSLPQEGVEVEILLGDENWEFHHGNMWHLLEREKNKGNSRIDSNSSLENLWL